MRDARLSLNFVTSLKCRIFSFIDHHNLLNQQSIQLQLPLIYQSTAKRPQPVRVMHNYSIS